MVHFIYIAVLIAIASFSYSEAQNFSIGQDAKQKECKGGPNDQWENSRYCDRTCEWRNKCLLSKRSSRCRCQKGTFRNNDGLCVSPRDCPIIDEPCRGGPNDYFIHDVNINESTCELPYIGFVPLNTSARSLLESKNGCRCVLGTVRHEDGRCVILEECPNITISENKCLGGPNDYWVNRLANSIILEKRCDSFHSLGPSIRVTRNGGCRCEDGTMRRRDGACVLPSECDVSSNQI